MELWASLNLCRFTTSQIFLEYRRLSNSRLITLYGRRHNWSLQVICKQICKESFDILDIFKLRYRYVRHYGLISTWIAEMYGVLWWRWNSHVLHSDTCCHNFGHILRYAWWDTSYLCLCSSHIPNNKTVDSTPVDLRLTRVLSEPCRLFEIATHVSLLFST